MPIQKGAGTLSHYFKLEYERNKLFIVARCLDF